MDLVQSICEESPHAVSVRVGWWCLCNCDTHVEPEGTITFSYSSPPKPGDLVRLGDGKDWTVVSVNPEELEFRVERKD